jgi:hypothetical protein
MAKHEPIISGTKFGRLTALDFMEMRYSPSGARRLFQQCVCDCGIVKFVSIYQLADGTTKSCGCLIAETTSKRSLTHGYSRANKRVYRIWTCIITRCTNKNSSNYERYGGRGITACERWRKFENFLEDMGEPPDGFSIDRLDNDGNYCKENCAWRSASDQALNRRKRRPNVKS